MAWDALFKQILTKELKEFDIRTDVPVGKLPLKIDLVVIRPEKTHKTKVLSSFISYLSKINIIEFKSTHDSILKTDLTKLLGYVGLYCNNNGLGIQDLNKIGAWYIIPHKPKFFNSLNKIKKDNGIYKLYFTFPFYIIIIDQLPNKYENIPFLLFSSKERLYDVLRLIIREKSLQRYLSISYLLYPKVMKKLASEEDYYTYKEIQENIKYAVNELGIKNVIEAVGLKEVIEAVGLKEVIEAVGLDKVEDELNKLKNK
ncbi:MAG: hypothetical protein ACTSPY_15130 [Candidatus Helarchaeota archaeon]